MLNKLVKRLQPYIYKLRPVFIGRFQARLKINQLVQNGLPVKVILGAGLTSYDGWISTEYPVFDITKKEHWTYFFRRGQPSNILAEHVIEHLYQDDFIKCLENIKSTLSEKCIFRVAVPDGFCPDQNYIDAVRPGGTGAGAQDHKELYTAEMIAQICARVGVSVNFIEFYDCDGNFTSNYSEQNGYISRCAKNDWRNKEGEQPVHTSLIFDLHFNV